VHCHCCSDLPFDLQWAALLGRAALANTVCAYYAEPALCYAVHCATLCTVLRCALCYAVHCATLCTVLRCALCVKVLHFPCGTAVHGAALCWHHCLCLHSSCAHSSVSRPGDSSCEFFCVHFGQVKGTGLGQGAWRVWMPVTSPHPPTQRPETGQFPNCYHQLSGWCVFQQWLRAAALGAMAGPLLESSFWCC
jgi:hypothetical protein